MQWLQRDLESVDRCVTPWLILLIHRPLYVVHPHKSNRVVGGTDIPYPEDLQPQKTLLPFQNYNVISSLEEKVLVAMKVQD